MKIVRDTEQVIRCLVKYASKPEKRSSNIDDLIFSMLPACEVAEE